MNPKQFQYLRIKTSKGFSFRIPNSIVLTTYPSMGIIFFLQSSIRFFDGAQFLQLYKTQNPISAISLRDKQLAIGQKLMKGQLTTTTVLNLQTKKTKKYRYQKTAIQMLSLSCGAEYLCSVGASDANKQELLVIDLMEELEFGFKSVCEEEYDRKGGRIVAAKFSNNDPRLLALTFATKFVILRIQGNKSMQKVAKSSKVRQFSMSLFDPKDISCYVSSKNGDISQINIKQMKQVRIGPRKRVIISGIKFVRHVNNGMNNGAGVLVVVGVKGFIGLIQLGDMKILKEVTIKEQIVSITEFQGDLAFVGTDKASIYILDAANLDIRQFYSCHSSKITQVCFLQTFNQVFATCADKQIILWRNNTLTPIIKISLPMASCISLNLLRDGTSIVSGWSDDCIRFFNPKTGKKINQIVNAHNGKITALTSNYGSDLLFSGGEDGRIRSWKLEKERFGVIDNIFSGHKALIHYLKLHQGQLYSCSQDGTFAIWDSKKAQKKAMVKVSNFLKKIIPIDEYLVYGIGSGPNLLKIAKNDGRILQTKYVGGSHLNDFDIYSAPDRQGKQSDRKFVIFGGELHSIFLHKVQELLGQSTMKPEQHYAYGQVTCVKFSPDANTVIAATADGSLLCFEFLPKGYIAN